MTRSYLRRWDIQNVLTILRGKDQGLSANRIKEVLIPAGELDREFLDRILLENSQERIVESLRRWRLYPVLAREFPKVGESGSYAHLENELYRAFYAEVIADARGGVRGGSQFLEYIKLDIDIRNLQNLLRLRTQKEREQGDVREFMIPGGSLTPEELQQLNMVEELDEFISTLKKHVYNKPLLSVLEDSLKRGVLQEGRLYENEIALIRIQLKQMEFMSRMHPFSIWTVIAYLELKKYEIFNLRAITRGKEANLPPDRIRNYLVM
jgi:V/A-type H+/Na+-transporting ATPase subunit C